jgi:hypothetical protein
MSFVELVQAVAARTGLPKDTVRLTLLGFRDELLASLHRGLHIRVPGLGTFYPAMTKERALFGGTRRGVPRRALRFRESRRYPMEKYSVVIDDEKTKTASEGKTCPKCGRALGTKDLNPPIPHCFNCGTEPFEKRPESE